jgi:tRNA modification GTPase
VVWDGTAAATEEDTNLLALARSRGHTVLVLSKSDLTPAEQPHLPDDLPVVRVSARSGQGLAELERAVSTFFPRGEAVLGSLLTNQRQADSVRRAQQGVSRALAALEAGLTPDAALSDVETALDALYELTGRRVTDEVTDRIFSRFCVGK